MTATTSSIPDDDLIDALNRAGQGASDPDAPRRTGPIRVAWAPRLNTGDPNASQVGTLRCMKCSWTFTGPMMEGMAQSLAHRTEKHPQLPAVSTRTKGQRTRKKGPTLGSAKAAPTDDVRVMVAELEKGPLTSRQLGALVGKGASTAGVTLNWARTKGYTTARLNPSRGRTEDRLWSLEPLPPPDDIQAVITILKSSGPKTAMDLADATGCLRRGMSWRLRAAVTKGWLPAHCDDDGLWHLGDPPEVD